MHSECGVTAASPVTVTELAYAIAFFVFMTTAVQTTSNRGASNDDVAADA
jgi:hypothetical protein